MGEVLDEKMEFFYNLIQCNYPMIHWVYSAQKEILSGPQNKEILKKVFESTGCQDYMIEYGESHSSPLILSAPLGIMWAATFEKKEEQLTRIYVMGPVKAADVSPDLLEKIIRKRDTTVEWHRMLVKELKNLPIISSTQFFQYAIMQHYCVTGVRLSISNLHYQQNETSEAEAESNEEQKKKNRKNTYMAEQELLYMVRTGDLNYKTSLDKASNVSAGIRMNVGDPLRQAKNSVIVFTSLCVRAAIKGGLSTDSSYARGDAYIQSIEECNTISEVTSISHMMYEDFIGCVNKHRVNNHYSKEIRNVCDYIRFHILDKIEVKELARLAGYTDYYFTRKFKKEVGMSVSEYIKMNKISKAKLMLVTTDDNIQEICEKLKLGSRSHFVEDFKSIVGCTPQDYRKKNKY